MVVGLGRVPVIKELVRTRLLKEYASWIYCTGCEKTVAYLCYVTYDRFDFKYTCTCGNHGSVYIEFDHEPAQKSGAALVLKKNRLCCPEDHSPLLTIVDKSLSDYSFSILCGACHREYTRERAAALAVEK